MSFGGFLLDEHNPPSLAEALRRAQADIPVQIVGVGSAPPLRTQDPDVLVWIEENDLILVTDNRRSMPVHLRRHLAAGRHVPGILTVRQRIVDWRTILADLALVWNAAVPDDFRDRIDYLPFRK